MCHQTGYKPMFVPLNAAQIEKVREEVLQDDRITEFQRKVYLETLTIPIGSTLTYKQLADRIGCRSPQAVGQALKRNPFAPMVPCHRVVGSDGSLTGYAFGLDHKRRLLEEERTYRKNQ